MTERFMTYKKWLKQNPEAELEEEECDKCNGEGDIECHNCGHLSECQECGGEGYIKTARQQYNDALERDKQKLEKYKKVFA